MPVGNEKVLVVVHIPGIDAIAARPSATTPSSPCGTGGIAALHACRDHDEACELAGLG
jgi:hypothetical protein